MRVRSSSPQATEALALVESLQSRFVAALEQLNGNPFSSVEWLRDEGCHGGGVRYGTGDGKRLGRASVNVSQVHYDDDPDRRLGSATAISTIVHPSHPSAPSVHIHISWTEMKTGAGYWRVMADLNPSMPNGAHRDQFRQALEHAVPGHYPEAAAQGDRYFHIPALNRHRGIVHFYLENFSTGEFERDLRMAQTVGEVAIDTYIDLLHSVDWDSEVRDESAAAQLAYHTLYFFQVLTLDRGTTSGLMVHDQNDIGILGSLPPKVDKNLLASWRSRMEAPQDRLLDKLLTVLPNSGVCVVGDDVKQRLAHAVRAHYLEFPEALDLQASGNSVPPTVQNHQ